jgi:hypothetical protein
MKNITVKITPFTLVCVTVVPEPIKTHWVYGTINHYLAFKEATLLIVGLMKTGEKKKLTFNP